MMDMMEGDFNYELCFCAEITFGYAVAICRHSLESILTNINLYGQHHVYPYELQICSVLALI